MPAPWSARLVRAAARHRFLVLGLWAIALLFAGRAAGSLPDLLKGGVGLAPGSASAAVEHALAHDFASPWAQTLVVLVGEPQRLEHPERPARVAPEQLDRARVAVRQALAHDPRVAAVRELDAPRPPAATPVLLVGLAARTQAGAEELVLPLRQVARAALAPYPGVEVVLTGDAAFGVDLVVLAAEASQTGERRVLPLTLLALLLIFGAPLAALLPLLTGVAAMTLAMGLLVPVATQVPLSVYASNITAMLGLGLGIDYALLALSRLREEPGPDAFGRAAPALTLSGITVLLALALLTTVPIQDLVGMGVGGALVAGTSVLAGLTLLPALVAVLGPWRDAPAALSRRLGGEAVARRWRALAARLVRHPWAALASALLILVPLTTGLFGLSLGFPEPEQMPRTMEATRGLRVLNTPTPVRGFSPVHLLVEAPASASMLTPARLAALARLQGELAADARVRQVVGLGSGATLAGAMFMGPQALRERLGGEASWLMDREGRRTLVEVFLGGEAGSEAHRAYAEALRSRLARGVPGLEDCRLQVGGLGAIGVDLAAAAGRAAPWIVLAACAVTLVLLGRFTRSWLLPLKAVLANLLVVAAALGGTASLIAHPVLSRWIGLESPVVHMPPGLPLIVFVLVYGLSMDYEVFLLSRVVEAHRRGRGDREAVIEGVGASAGVITGGALVMGIVFLGFASAPLMLVKVLGVALALGLLLDATVVRLLLVPACIVLLGRHNWVPGFGPEVEARGVE